MEQGRVIRMSEALDTIGTHPVHPAANAFPLLTADEAAALAYDIRRHGLRKPITLVERDGRSFVLDGRNRYRACLAVGVRPYFDTYSGDDPVSFVISQNLMRRHLTESQRALAAAQLANLQPGANQHVVASNEATTQAEAAAALHVSRSSVQRARRVLEQGTEGLVDAVRRGDVDVGFAAQFSKRPADEQDAFVERVIDALKTKRTVNAKQVARTLQRELVADQIRREPAPLPTGPFRVIAADPCWRYDVRDEDGTHRGNVDYPTMTPQEIAALPVLERAHTDAVLWLWITNAMLIDGAHLPILDAWGFVGKTILTWEKDRMGLGNYLRNITEHCIVAVRGAPTLMLTNETTMIHAARREHSRKPDEFYALVERLCPGSKLELFAREQRDGWRTWGAEETKFAAAAAV